MKSRSILAADVGGTKTYIALHDISDQKSIADVNNIVEKYYLNQDFTSFYDLLAEFLEEAGFRGVLIDRMVLALPGRTDKQPVNLTNIDWEVDSRTIIERFDVKDVSLMNDFQASAYGTYALATDDYIVLNQAESIEGSVRVSVGAGTGLGLAWSEINHGVINAYSTEGGHIDFAPRDEQQVSLFRYLKQRYGHVSYERILSGPGLVTLFDYYSGKETHGKDAAEISRMSESDRSARSALEMFVQIYGAYVGNIALLYKPFGGLYITGGIAAKIIDAMRSELFTTALLEKGRMSELVEKTPVYLVTEDRIGLFGALTAAKNDLKQEIK